MFDYRYHALSLAAVLFALAVGVLIGVAIGDSNLVSSARDGIVENLRSEVGESHQANDKLGTKLDEEEAFAGALYPIAVHELLAGRSIGLVFLGASSDELDALVRDAVTQAGGSLKAVVVVRAPLDAAGVAAQATGTRYAALGEEPKLVKRFGLRIGKQLLTGGQLLERVHGRLLSSYAGELGKLEGLVVVRSDLSRLPSEELTSTNDFESGLIEGAAAVGVSPVGVELTSTEPSQVPWYKSHDMASVDDLDTLAGRAALAFALAGDHGAYGVKPTADALLPHVVGTPG